MPYFSVNDLQFKLRRGFTADQVATALHEVSHAVVAMALGHRVTHVSIEHKPHGTQTWRGQCRHQGYRDRDRIGEQTDRALIIAAPLAAMGFADGVIAYAENGVADSDQRDFTELHREIEPGLSYLDFQHRCTRAARDILDAHSTALENITHALLVCGHLDEAALRATPGGIALRWEAHKQPESKPIIPAPRRTSQPRPSPRSRDVIPGLRYSDTAAMTPRGRAA